jgi:hypothetical protein
MAVVLSLPCPLRAGTVVYLDDIFSNTSLTNQNLPSSAAWFDAGSASGMSVVNNGLVLNTASNNDAVLAYFSPTTVTLGIGDSLEVSFDFAVSGTLAPQDRAFAVYLYDSGGNRETADGSGFNAPLFNGYTGYGITYDPDSTNFQRYRTVERSGTANNLISDTPNVIIGTSQASSILTTGHTYSGSLTLTRTATSISVNGDINGSLISNIDPSSSYTQFDTIAFQALSADIPTLTLEDIEVSETFVPEPSTAAFLGCGLLLLLARKVLGRFL